MSVPETASSLLKKLQGLSLEEVERDAVTKKEALKLTRALTTQLQDPVNVATELMFSPYIAMSARVAVDLDLFALVAESDKPISPEELATKSAAEPELVARLVRLLAALGFFHDAGEELYSATPITKAAATSTLQSGYRFIWDIFINAVAKTPKFFRENHHHTGSEPHDGLIQYGHHTKLPFFPFLASMPSMMQDFNIFMGNTMGASQYWVDWYPVKDSLLNGLRPDSPLLVDMGGGKGHDLESFHDQYPNQGALILQELPHIVEAGNAKDSVFECMVHDFFTEQPVKGARAYFMHHILHDWADEKCLLILKHIKAAMSPNYSKILIHDLVLPNQNASAYQCVWDLTMMTVNWGKERSERQWRILLEKAGFKHIKFMVPDSDADGIIEVTG